MACQGPRPAFGPYLSLLGRTKTFEPAAVTLISFGLTWLAMGMIALIGLPPFGLFLSKFAVVRAGFAADRPWLMIAVLALLAMAFVALVAHLNRMLYGATPPDVAVGEIRVFDLAPLVLCMAVLVVLGLTIPAPVEALLTRVVEIVAR